jgi:hypothetical protein
MPLISGKKKCNCGEGLCEHDFSCAFQGGKEDPKMQEAFEAAKKFDSDKPIWAAAPFLAFEEVVKVMTFGAKKYGMYNYLSKGGLSFSRFFSAAFRHITAWWKGEDIDPESGLHHLAHAGCCILMVLEYVLRNIGKDDRPLKGKVDK